MYAQSNGMSESAVHTVKNLLKEATDDDRDMPIALLEYGNSPVSSLDDSPAELLMSRSLKGKLPIAGVLLKPKVATYVSRQLARQQVRPKDYYDTGTQDLSHYHTYLLDVCWVKFTNSTDVRRGKSTGP